MKILGVESSCDETSAAVVENGRQVLSNIVASQIPVHERFGGVVPEIASRQHVLAIEEVVARALREADVSIDDLDAVAATFGPGLSGPLLVGTSFAKGLSMSSKLPLHAVNHVEGHILSVWLGSDEPFQLPMVSLVVSGGHTQLVLVKEPGVYEMLGQTVDDAAGEAFDKVGRLLGLAYPGGPNLELAASEGTVDGITMPRAWLQGTHDFSFSGLKTAVSREVSRLRGPEPTTDDLRWTDVVAVAAAFQESVADVLTRKLALAVAEKHANSAAIVGGVANNSFIRGMARDRVTCPLHVPGPGLSSDNAAMIAGAAFWHPRPVGLDCDVDPNMRM